MSFTTLRCCTLPLRWRCSFGAICLNFSKTLETQKSAITSVKHSNCWTTLPDLTVSEIRAVLQTQCYWEFASRCKSHRHYLVSVEFLSSQFVICATTRPRRPHRSATTPSTLGDPARPRLHMLSTAQVRKSGRSKGRTSKSLRIMSTSFRQETSLTVFFSLLIVIVVLVGILKGGAPFKVLQVATSIVRLPRGSSSLRVLKHLI